MSEQDIPVPVPTKTEINVENILYSLQNLEHTVNNIAKFKADIISEIQSLKPKKEEEQEENEWLSD